MGKLENPDDLEDGLEYQVDSDEEVEAVEIKEDESEDEVVQGDEASSIGKKRKKTNDKLKEKKRVKMEQDIQKKKNLAVSDSSELAEFFTQVLLQQNDDATQLDYFKKSDFVDASKYKEKRSLDNLKDFTDKYNKGLTIILAMNRIRIGDLFKALGPKSKALKVGKGYEFKMRDDTKYIIGTVERVLNLDLTKYPVKSIILDASYQDMKTHSVLDEPKLTTLLKKYEGIKTILY
jgi:protein CMS1